MSFFYTQVQTDTKLYKIGDEANLFYIIQSGSVELIPENGESIYISDEACFGLTAASEEDLVRLKTAIAMDTCELLCLTREMYRDACNYMVLKNINEKIIALKTIPLFKNLEHEIVLNLSHLMEKVSYKMNSIIHCEDDYFTKVYIIIDGSIKCSKNYKKVRKLTSKDYFGDIGLVYKSKAFYTYSVESESCIILELNHLNVRNVMGDNYCKDLLYKIFISSIHKSERLINCMFNNMHDLFSVMKLKYYVNEEVVYPMQTTKNKKLCIIISGHLKKSGKNDYVAKGEDCFGEDIIDLKTNLDANIISFDETLILETQWEDLLKNTKINNNHTLYEQVLKMKKLPLFATIGEMKIFQLCKKLKKENYGNGQEIITEGSMGDKFYIIKAGKVKVYKGREFVREMETGSTFGEISLLTNFIRSATVKASGTVECYVLSKESFDEVIDINLLKHLQKVISLQDISVTLEELFFVKILGMGRFGKVYLVHNQKNFYAVKCAKIKIVCKNQSLIRYYLNEKNIMLQTDFPFIIKLVKTMKNKEFIFFLLEYIDGIPLKNYLDKRKKVSLKNLYETTFYGATLLCIINYIHKKNIIHRDIKPDNLMIDKNGYLKVIDFGVAKELKDKDTTQTCCGTPHYLAPEVLMGKGYSYSADYWAVGITMFEIFYGYYPFGTNSKDIMEIYHEILNKKLTIPYDPKFNDINNFFKIILSKNLLQRVCNFQLLRSHPLWMNYDFVNKLI